MKFIHNGPVGKAFSWILLLGIHGLFAFGMYLLGEFIGGFVLGDIPQGPHIFAITLAVVMFFSALYAFIYHEYTKEDVEAYESTEKGDGTFRRALDQLIWIVAGMELSSLLFRCYRMLPGNWVGAIITLSLGLLLLWLAFVLGKVIHATVNRPAEVLAGYMRNEAGRRIFSEGGKHLKKMNVDQLRRIWGGDPTPIDEVRDVKGRERQAEEEKAGERRRRSEEEHGKNRGFASRFLAPRDQSPFVDAQSNQAENLSSRNGHR